MTISDDNKKILEYLESVTGEATEINEYWDEDDAHSIDLMAVADAPDEGVTTYSTLGLSDVDTGQTVDDIKLGAEIIIAADSHREEAANILAICAFNMIKENFEIGPGAIFADAAGTYLPDSDMKHIMFVAPFLWELETQDLANKKAAWLQAVPISEAELEYAEEHGTEALEDLFVEKQIDVYDLDRKSVV